MIANTPEPPYYAVIFTNERVNHDENSDNHVEYTQTAKEMIELASKVDGYLGFESVRNGLPGISVSYWRNHNSIQNWYHQSKHQIAQERGKKEWYQSYQARVCYVERDYKFECTSTEY